MCCTTCLNSVEVHCESSLCSEVLFLLRQQLLDRQSERQQPLPVRLILQLGAAQLVDHLAHDGVEFLRLTPQRHQTRVLRQRHAHPVEVNRHHGALLHRPQEVGGILVVIVIVLLRKGVPFNNDA